MPPIAIAAAIGVAGSVAGGAISSSAAGRAADTQSAASLEAARIQAQSAREALDFQKQMWATQQANIAPWLQTGQGALGNLGYLMGIAGPQASTITAPAATPSGTPGTPTAALPGGRVPGAGVDLGLRGNGIPLFQASQAAPGDTGFLPGVSATATAVPGSADTAEGTTMTPPPGMSPEDFGSLMQNWTTPFVAPTVTDDPGYQFRLQEGMKALERSAAARGGVLSGATAKDITNYAQGMASQEYGNAYNRALNEYRQSYDIFNNNQSNRFNRLATLSGFGQSAAGTLASSGNQVSQNVGNILLGGAQQQGNALQNAAAARASGYVGGANAWGGALGNLGNNVGQLLLLQQLGAGGAGSNPFAGQTQGWGAWS